MKRFLCFLFVHRYASLKEFGHGQRMVGCWRCHRVWGMHDGVQLLVPWDDDLTQLYSERGLL